MGDLILEFKEIHILPKGIPHHVHVIYTMEKVNNILDFIFHESLKRSKIWFFGKVPIAQLGWDPKEWQWIKMEVLKFW